MSLRIRIPAYNVPRWRCCADWRAQIEDHPLVSFLPLDLTNPDSIDTVLSHIDYTMQYGEDEEPKEVRTLPSCALTFCADFAPASLSSPVYT